MAILIKALGATTVATSGTATLYTVPAAKSAIVNNLRLVNGGTNPSPALNLYVRASGGVSRRIHNRDFTIAGNGSLVLPDVMTLAQGDSVQLELATSMGGVGIGCMLNGVERD